MNDMLEIVEQLCFFSVCHSGESRNPVDLRYFLDAGIRRHDEISLKEST